MKSFLNALISLFVSGYQVFRTSRLARILLIIVVVKFLVFFVFLKGFLYPRYLEPQYGSEQQQSEQVIRDFTTIHKPSEQ